MIVEEKYNENLIKRYSDIEGKKLHKIGTEEYYSVAVDLITSPYTYEEVDDPDYKPDDSEPETVNGIINE